MKKNAAVHKDKNPIKNSITPASLSLFEKLSDSVSWKIDTTVSSSEFLSVTSSNPSIVPATSGGNGSDTLDVTPIYPTTKGIFPVSYDVYLNNGSGDRVAGGFLVIDTIGPPKRQCDGRDGDEPGEGGHRHEGHD